MAITTPTGRVNYEPNSRGADGGPRESNKIGFRSFPAAESGDKLRIRSESFADHYSQARQFYVSQTPVEQGHIADSFIFELSKVETPAIRTRLISNLLNVDEGLAEKVIEGLGLREVPRPSKPAKAPITDLPPSKALSIAQNGPTSFKGRKIGALVTEGVDQVLLDALQKAIEAEGAILEIIAPTVGGVTSSAGAAVVATQKLGGGPSVLYDAVAVLAGDGTGQMLAKHPAARDFVTDAFTHLKFMTYTDAAKPLFEKTGLFADLDEGCVELTKAAVASTFVKRCRSLRFWDREAVVKS